MERNKRHEKIVVLVRAAGEASVDELAEKLNVSKETIRRDLIQLDEKGLIKKFHGGAKAEVSPFEGIKKTSLTQCLSNYGEEKRKLCTTAAKLLKTGDTLFLNFGSTAVIFAGIIADMPKLIIATNSITIAKIVSANPHHEVFLLGGNYRSDHNLTVGILTLEQIEKFHARYAVLTVGAVNDGFVSDFNLQATEIARAMMKCSEQTIILADHSKFAKQGTFAVAPLKDIDYLVTDQKPDNIMTGVYDQLPMKLLISS